MKLTNAQANLIRRLKEGKYGYAPYGSHPNGAYFGLIGARTATCDKLIKMGLIRKVQAKTKSIAGDAVIFPVVVIFDDERFNHLASVE